MLDPVKLKISQSLEDEFLSKEESKDIFTSLGMVYLSPKERVELVQYAIKLATEKSNDHNQQYIFKWLKKLTNVLGDFGSDELHNNAYFSHTHNIRSKVIHSIEVANESLDVCLFTISDNQIANKIIQAKTRGIKVRVITDDEKIMDRGSDIFRFKHKGIPVKIDSNKSLMHHKFAIIDGRKVISGSYNWTRSGSEINNENIIITDNHRIVTAFESEFNKLWQQMENL